MNSSTCTPCAKSDPELVAKSIYGLTGIATFVACRFSWSSVKKMVVSLWKKLFGDGPDTDNLEADAPVDLDAFRTQFIQFQ
jgi:hypothetical protein